MALLHSSAAVADALPEDWPSDPYRYFVLAEAEAWRLTQVEWIGGEMDLTLA